MCPSAGVMHARNERRRLDARRGSLATEHGTDPRPPGRRPTHGFRALERLLRQHGLAVVDGRSTLGRELAHWRQCHADDLGGDPSAAQATVIERIAAKRLMVGALETFILSAPSTLLVKERLYLVNLYRQMSDSLRADLVTLGLERRAKEVDLVGEIAQLQRDAEAARRQQQEHRARTHPRGRTVEVRAVEGMKPTGS